ncbi:hypothetical protein [Aurantimonas sp. VKM B-3413]|uniref:hypothetical protein n=1 Tax=Aurantimonas sp. VKM B-3413 TaxID=2779401 RepID=UPI001E5ECAD1|nr:hypothetical protein [Aurantimonas sp. VKM B-3413]MCB8838600.1 hypothetical protein [Aurantimonas sp. VKM B-3413]
MRPEAKYSREHRPRGTLGFLILALVVFAIAAGVLAADWMKNPSQNIDPIQQGAPGDLSR